MNMGALINTFCSPVFAIGDSVGGYKAFTFIRHEVIKQSQKGLPSLERFSRELTRQTESSRTD